MLNDLKRVWGILLKKEKNSIFITPLSSVKSANLLVENNIKNTTMELNKENSWKVFLNLE